MSTSYDDINYCLYVLYKTIYNKDPNECYLLDTIVKKNIKIEHIRKNPTFDYTDIFKAEFKLMGIYNDRIHYKRISPNEHTSTVSIGYQNKNINMNDILRPELYNAAMMFMSSDIVINENFKHILMPIMSFDIKKDKLLQLLPNIKKDFSDYIEKNNHNQNLYVCITEHYFKMYTLREFIEENLDIISTEQLKSIIFQIMLTLNKLSERFNKFRHNNLNLDSIRLYLKTKSNDIYKIGNTQYIINENDIEIKITDFDYSFHLSEYTQNTNAEKFVNNGSVENPYYDIYCIIHHIYLLLVKHNKNNNIKSLLKTFSELFIKILPENKRVQNESEIKDKSLDTTEIITPRDIITHKFFESYKNIIAGGGKTINNNKEDKFSLLNNDSNIKYIDSNFLNKIKNKKSKQYYSTMIKGSRKIAVNGLKKSMIESSISSEQDSSFSASSALRTMTQTPKASDINVDNTSESTISRSKTMTGGTSPSSSSSSTGTGSKSKSSSSSSSVSSSVKTKTARTTEKSTESSLSSRSVKKDNGMKLDNKTKKTLEKFSDKYFDQAPDSLLHNLNLNDMGMNPVEQPQSQMNDMSLMQQMGMPGMPQMPQMPQQMGMPQMPPQMPMPNMPQMQPQAYPPMPAEMMAKAMEAQGSNPMLQNGLNVPMMNNPMAQMLNMPQMPQMQMGGGKKKLYKLKLDKDFFF